VPGGYTYIKARVSLNHTFTYRHTKLLNLHRIPLNQTCKVTTMQLSTVALLLVAAVVSSQARTYLPEASEYGSPYPYISTEKINVSMYSIVCIN